MYPYKDTQFNTLVALIKASNPALQVQLAPSDLRTLVPTVVTADSFGRNTSLRLMARNSSTVAYGSQTVLYRRIDLTSLFRSMTPLTFSSYSSSGNTISATDFCTAFNKRFGTLLVPSDFTNTTFTSGTQATLTMSGSSLIYVGNVTVLWSSGKANLADVLTGKTLNGKLYPGGNSFPGGRKPQGEYICYGLDFSPINTNLKAATNGAVTTWATDTNYSAILAFLQSKIPGQNFNSGAASTQGGLSGLTVTRYTLPSASVPDANSDKYGFCTVIQSLSDSWFQGRLLLHYT
jgi:hypothetical protein